MTFLQLRPGVDKGSFFSEVKRRFGHRIIFMSAASNLPDSVSVILWSASMKDSMYAEASFRADPSVGSCNHYLIQYKYQFPTWRERLLEQRAEEAEGR